MAARRPRVAVSIGANPHVRDVGPVAIDEPAGLGSWVLDPASGALTVSPGLRRIFGWPRHVVPRFAWFGEGVHPDDRVAAAAWLARVRVGKPAGDPCVFRVQAHDGDQRTIMVRATVVRANGRRQVLGAVQDLGDASAGPLAAIGAEQVFRGMFEHSVVGIFQSTPDGRYIMVNPALSRIYGYGSPAELRAALTDIGGQLYVDQARREEFVRQMRAHGAVSNFESQVYRGDGRIIWIAESCREVRTDAGVLLYYEGMVSDVTERRRIEDELREARDEAETANRVKNDFLATMSHELRTPLNAIIGFSESMQRELLGPIGTKVYKDYAGLILDSGRHLLAIITDILDIVRMDSGRLALQDDVVDIAALARDAARLLAAHIGAAGVSVTVAAASGLLVRAEEMRLKQVLLNLIGNAVKFTPEGGTVTIACERTPGGATRIVVSDTGIGIAPEAIAKVKEPFFQVEGAMSRRHDGSGLGLAIADRLIRLHGGRIDLASRPGEGTAVTITLPPERAIDLNR